MFKLRKVSQFQPDWLQPWMPLWTGAVATSFWRSWRRSKPASIGSGRRKSMNWLPRPGIATITPKDARLYRCWEGRGRQGLSRCGMGSDAEDQQLTIEARLRRTPSAWQLAWVTAGQFVMDREGTDARALPHEVRISRGFWMGVREVNQNQYAAIMGENPCRTQGDDLPVTFINWNDAVEFCRRLSQREGKIYRLPTEAEWNTPVAWRQSKTVGRAIPARSMHPAWRICTIALRSGATIGSAPSTISPVLNWTRRDRRGRVHCEDALFEAVADRDRQAICGLRVPSGFIWSPKGCSTGWASASYAKTIESSASRRC